MSASEKASLADMSVYLTDIFDNGVFGDEHEAE
jgi:hypothetical protein